MAETVIINPRSKGRTGCTFCVESVACWLGCHAVPWQGANLDDRHPAFARRYPHRVVDVHLGDGIEARGELLRVFKRAFEAVEPVYIVDSRAQADRLIIDAMRGLKILDIAEELGVKIVFSIIPFDDDEHVHNLIDLIDFADDRVNWLVIQNPTHTPCRAYPGSGVQKALKKLGAQEITLPGISAPTMLTLERHSLKIGRELSLAAAAQDNGLPLINRAEIQEFLGQVYLQLDEIAGHLLPAEQVSKLKIISKTRVDQAKNKLQSLLSDYGNNLEY